MQKEGRFKTRLIHTLEEMFPGCVILKNDANYMQGIPDLLILWRNMWGMLETKRSANESYEPNQEWYIDMLDSMSFAAMICPENEEEVLRALQSAFSARRQTRVSVR